ncbi:MAG: ABC transporter ATP-binding protein [Enterococcus sp.]
MGLSVNNLYVNYGKKEILTDLSFDVAEGETVALFGPSGVGKTSLLKILAGIQKSDRGTITFSDSFSQEETILVFQDFWLFPHMTVTENIAFGLKARKLSRAIIQEKLQKIITVFDLKGLENQFPDQLSGGQQQRVALARAIVLEPKLLLLDEPFANLDSQLKLTMRSYLQRLQQEYRFSVILVTHDRDEAFHLADRMILLLDGAIQQIGTPQELYFYPLNQQVAEAIGEGNYLSGNVQGESFQIGTTTLAVKNPQQLVGEARVFIPYGTEIAISEQGLPARVFSNDWSPNGQRTQLQIGECLCTFTNLSQKVRTGTKIYLNFQQSLQVLPV